jgi:cyclopropane fatty-acyl-phospholipid synthase-like methyltransferase
MPDHAAIRAHYVQTLDDYRRWSRGYNMHFGHWKRGMNPFDREAMLEAANEEVIASLELPRAATFRVVDFGCGAGATSRALARLYPRAEITGVTLVAEQIELATRLNREAKLARRIGFVLCDFAGTWLGAKSQDGAFAIESFCYAQGSDKAGALREAARVLRPGARLTVVDGFLLAKEPGGVVGWIARHLRDGWAISQFAVIGDFTRAMRAEGFEDIEVRDLSWRIAPSVAHVPWVATTHMLRELWRHRGRLSSWEWKHIASSWLAMFLGLARNTFRYYLVKARRASE